jgi:hypothetical protein
VSSAIGRVLARPRGRLDGYAFCAGDGFWFRPAYTAGKCPLCGVPAPGGTSPLPLRLDRSWLGVAALALESLVMLALVLFMYFKG